MCESSKATSKIINLPLLSKIHSVSTLQSSFGFMSIITPLLFVVPWLKKTLPPHSADHASALSFELCVSWRTVKCTFWLWIHLKTDRRFIDLLRPLVLTERHLMSKFSKVFVLKGQCYTFATKKTHTHWVHFKHVQINLNKALQMASAWKRTELRFGLDTTNFSAHLLLSEW